MNMRWFYSKTYSSESCPYSKLNLGKQEFNNSAWILEIFQLADLAGIILEISIFQSKRTTLQR
jgi:hypothetical protein